MPLPRRPPGDSSHHIQAAQQLFACTHAFGIFVLDLATGAEEQLWIVDDAVLYVDRALAPGSIDLANFASAELITGNLFGKAFAGAAVGARNRNQVLHGRMRSDFPEADVLLDRLGQLAHQRQAARNPRHASVKTPGKIVQVQTQALVQLRKQPSLFECCLSFGRAQGPVQNQRFGFIHVPNRRAYRVASETLQCSDPLVAVNDKKSIRLFRQGNDYDRNLLSPLSQRSQQTPFAVRPEHPKPLVTQIQLVKFQIHVDSSLAPRSSSGGKERWNWFFAANGEVFLDLMQIQQVDPGTGFSRGPGEVSPNPL